MGCTVRLGLVGLVAATVLLAGSVGSAFAVGPWWHLSVGSRPTYLRPGVARDEVYKLTVPANEGVYVLERSGVGQALLQAGETPENVQRAFEGELEYGAGNVQVSGVAGPNSPYEVYEVKFVGGLTDQPVEAPRIGVDQVKREVGGKEVASAVGIEQVSSGRPDGQILVTAVNLGFASADPRTEPVVLAGRLPAGLKAVGIEGYVDERLTQEFAYPMSCVLASLTCTFTGTSSMGATLIPPYDQVQMRVDVNLKPSAHTGETAEATVAGGGAPGQTAKRALTVSTAPVPFGVSTYEMRPEEPGGTADTQAGSHPFQLTTTVGFNETFEGKAIFTEGVNALEESAKLAGGNVPALTKDLHFDLPPGLIGNPTPFAQCPLGEFLKVGEGPSKENSCSAQTVVGVARVVLNVPEFGTTAFVVPLFNVVPAIGEPARFGFLVYGVPVMLNTAIRTGGDYGVTVNVTNISQEAEFLGSEVTFWGVPGDHRHDNSRNWTCQRRETLLATSISVAETKEIESAYPCGPFEAVNPPPLLSLPPSCTGALQTSMMGDSWAQPNVSVVQSNTAPMPSLDGCNDLQFAPSIEVAPDGHAGSTPTGLAVRARVPQEVSLDAEGLSEADVKNTTVTLPAGVAINPAGADGLQACSQAQVGLNSPGRSSCPDASKIGLVRIKTPLLPNALEGAAYLAEQDNNPFGSLIAIYVVAEDPVSGSRVKLAGEVIPDPVTGQLVSTFKNTPELPFELFELHFFGGDRAPLATPGYCGPYTTSGSFEASSGGAPTDSSSVFEVFSGPNGSGCFDPLPFDPSLTAGTTSIQAGGFSPFTMTMSRQDGQQTLQAVSLHMPPGVSGLLTGVKLCPEAQANAGTCPPESQIGETIVSVGVGGDPFSVKGGKVYITEGYDGAPYGLSIVNPAKAGPFDLGEVVVRAKIEVDPITAQLTVTTDKTGPYKIPTILDGIPLEIQHVNVLINRPAFTFNPTNCNPMQITATLTSVEGATSTLGVPMQVTNCAVLGFKPGFQVSTNGKTSRQTGASLHVKLTYPKTPFGSQANIRSVKVDLPRQLPSNLKTLQHACPHQTFETNPADCPPESRVGEAKATTPLLPVALTGPAYFVSYGAAKFPELVIVLSGYGTTVQLHGETYINEHTNITSSTFHTVPDVPVGTFELTLPQGKYSALAAPTPLCNHKLIMPTLFTAQNGTTIKQNTPITTTGCPKHKTPHKTKHKPHH